MSTDNYKHNKVSLKEEGVNYDALGSRIPGGEKDQLFWLTPGSKQYEPFTRRDWTLLSGGQSRL